MKKIQLVLFLMTFGIMNAFSQTAYNPFTQNIHFAPEPTAFGFECGTTQTVTFTQGLTTADDATQWQTNPLTVTICVSGFQLVGSASSLVSGSYAANFNWAYAVGSSNCIIGTQNQTIVGTGYDPIFPNAGSSGPISLSLKVPDSSPVGTVLSVNVSLQVPAYMSLFNSIPDDNESTQTQTFCNCYALTDPGAILGAQTFCGSGNPVAFTSSAAGTGGSGSTVIYQWQQLIGSTWTDISGANGATYDASTLTATTQFRRNAKRQACGTWLSSNILTVTINPIPVADAGLDKNLTCTTPSTTIGTTGVSGNTYAWSPATALSTTNAAMPTANPTSTVTYTVTVTNASGCTATDAVLVTVNKTTPTVDAGLDKNLNCTTTSTTIGTTSISGNSYSWANATGLSSINIAQPVANPTVTTTYTVTVTGSNGCTATDVVIVNVNTTLPSVDAGLDKSLNCTLTSTIIGTTAVAGITYSWSPALGLSATNIAQPTASPAATTNYTVTATSANGCTATDVVSVSVNTTLPIANAGPDKLNNCTSTTSIIGTTAISGSSYSWSPTLGLNSTTSATPTANPASTTTYTVTVTGANGCTATDEVLVTVDKTAPTADAGLDKNLTCTTTSAIIGTTAVVGNTYSWTPTTNLSSASIAQPTASPVATTIYTVTVTSLNGCIATDVVIVNVNTTLPSVDAGLDKNLNCTTTSTSIGTTAVSGVTYSWNPSTGLSANNVANPTANPIATTTYTVTATGSNGCTATDVVTVSVNTSLPTVNAGPDKVNNCTSTSTTIGTTAISGSTYVWSPAAGLSSTTSAQPTANPISTTTYTVTVTGANGCTATDAVLVTVDKTNPIADAGLDKNLNCTTTSIIIGTTAIVGNTYSWSPSTNLSASNIAQPTANPSTTRTYTVTVTSANGCSSTDAVVVNVNTTLPTVNAGPNKDLDCITTSSTIGTTEISGNTYVWSPATGLSSTTAAQPIANPTTTTNYTITVTGSNGCTATDIVTVNVNTTLPTANAGTDKTINCLVPSAIIGTTAQSGSTYSWSPALGLNSTTIAQPTAQPTATTTYTVTVTGTNGCTSTDAVLVTVDKGSPIVDAGLDKNLNCTTTSTTIGTTDIVGNSYSWSPSIGLSSTTAAMPTANPTSTKTYTVTVTGTNGCTASDVVTVNVNTTPPTANAGPSKTICKDSSTVIGTTAVSGNTYSWSPSTGLSASNIAQPTASPSNTTNYTVTVTGSNGCSATSVVTVTVNICVINVSGNVFNDVNGLSNTNVDGTGIGSPSGTQVYANLIDPSGNVVASVPVNSNGTYQINNVPVNTTYTMVLNTVQGTTGNPAPTASLPSDWMNTGEDCCDNNGSDGLVNGVTTLTVGTTDVPNVNFGIQQPPTPGTNIQPTQVNPGGTVCVPVPANAWSGTDPSNGTISSLTLTAFPSNATSITVNGINYTSSNFPSGGITILTNTLGQPTSTQSICVDPINGSVTVEFPYSVTDNAGATSTPTGSVQVPFGIINISGNVYVDNNGPTNVDGTGIGAPSSTQLYANLINASGNVIMTTPINTNGTYQFNDVTPNSTYSVVLSTTNGTIGSLAPVASLPTGWANVSEDCCDNTGNDAITDGMTAVIVGTSNVPQVNFGIREPLSLGNLVWVDANRNGIKDLTELGISGASVNLYLDANQDGVPDGAAIQNTTTNGNGNYVFNGLNTSSYIVGVTPPAISGGTYTSSITGQEANPNLNVDNNDNGVGMASSEVRSGFVTLVAGTEPTGELPNNATAPDLNANLTVDFGFFVCPSNFTFTPKYLCAGETLDLTTIEPINYTGGVWTNIIGNPVSSNLVGKGTYTYTFTDGTCTATGTITLSDNVPDYTPTITIAPSAITGISNVRVIIKVDEILNRKSCSPIYVLVPRLEPRFAFSYLTTATTVGGVAVSNADWQYFSTNPNFYIWKYIGNATFPANGSSKFGYIGSYNPNDTDGETTFSVQIFQGSGGETNQVNNTDSESLIYFR